MLFPFPFPANSEIKQILHHAFWQHWLVSLFQSELVLHLLRCMELGHSVDAVHMQDTKSDSTERLWLLGGKRRRSAEKCVNRPNSRCTKSSIMSLNYQNATPARRAGPRVSTLTQPTTFSSLLHWNKFIKVFLLLLFSPLRLTYVWKGPT